MKPQVRRHLWSLIVAALLLLLTGQLISARRASQEEPQIHEMHMSWRMTPKKLQDVRDRAPLIVLADVKSVQRGPDWVTHLVGEPNDEARMPTQRITVSVIKVYRGEASPGEDLTLFQTGGTTDDYPFPRFAEDNPPYKEGERYVFMLEPTGLIEPTGETGLFRLFAAEGRYRIGRNDTITPMVYNDVTNVLQGKPLTFLEQALAIP